MGYPLQIKEIGVRVTGLSAGVKVKLRDAFQQNIPVEKRADSQVLLYILRRQLA
ncbi:MAG: hypothetical protein N2Z22_03145 [Turneriella sp.]|nr:hypothetical protein [Turneriella sp.]